MRAAASLLLLVGCAEAQGAREALPGPSAVAAPSVSAVAAAPSASDLPAAPEVAAPPVVERVRVPGDLPAAIVRGRGGTAPRVVFLPGLCSNGHAYLHGFPEAAREAGGVVALEGDTPCGADPRFRSLSNDPARQHARIEAALAAAGALAVPADGLAVVGYSRGATVAEQLVARWPARYPRVVLIGAPRDPLPGLLRGARGVVTMSCERDVPGRMARGARSVAALGVPATYLEMPRCTHGHLEEGDRVLGEAFAWLAAHALPTPAGTAATPIVGRLD